MSKVKIKKAKMHNKDDEDIQNPETNTGTISKTVFEIVLICLLVNKRTLNIF